MKGAAPWALSFVMIGCGGAPDAESRRTSSEVEAQLAAVKSATIPSGISHADSTGPTSKGYLVSAEWSFDLQADWDAYASQGAASLKRAGYEAVGRGDDILAFSKHIPGDSYRVRIARKGSGSAARVTVSFSASPD